MSLFNQTMGVKFFVDGMPYIEGQQIGNKITFTFELLKMSSKLKLLFKRDRVAIGDVFYDKNSSFLHVIGLQKTIDDIETVTKINNIFGYKHLMVYSFSSFNYFGDKNDTIKTQVTLRYIECKDYNLEYCGNIFADIHAVSHYFVKEKITDNSSHFIVQNNLNHIKELILPNIEKTALFFYTKDEKGISTSSYYNLKATYNLEYLESIYKILNDKPYSLFVNINNIHQLIQNGYCEFILGEDKDTIVGYFITINEYGEIILINDRGNEIHPELINKKYQLHSFIDSNHITVESDKTKFMNKLYNVISLI